MIAPISTSPLKDSFPALAPGLVTMNRGQETGNRAAGAIPVDILWSNLRGLADDLLRSRAVALCRPIDERVRGEAYVYIADLIAGWVDRAERGDTDGSGLDPERMLEEGMTRLWIRLNGSGRNGR